MRHIQKSRQKSNRNKGQTPKLPKGEQSFSLSDSDCDNQVQLINTSLFSCYKKEKPCIFCANHPHTTDCGSKTMKSLYYFLAHSLCLNVNFSALISMGLTSELPTLWNVRLDWVLPPQGASLCFTKCSNARTRLAGSFCNQDKDHILL